MLKMDTILACAGGRDLKLKQRSNKARRTKCCVTPHNELAMIVHMWNDQPSWTI